MATKEYNSYKAPQGNMTEDEFIQLISDKEKLEDYKKHFNLSTYKCPPKKYCITTCFYCTDCIKEAIKLNKQDLKNKRKKEEKLK